MTQNTDVSECAESFRLNFCPYKGSPDPWVVWQAAWQAARRTPAAQVPQEALALLRWAEFLLCTSLPMSGQQQEAWPNLQKAADEMRILQRVALAAAPQPPEARKPLTDEEIAEGMATCDVAPGDAELGTFTEGVRFAERVRGITGEPT